MVCLLAGGIAGCKTTPQHVVAAPRQHAVQADGFTLYSAFEIDRSHPLVEELSLLREQVRHDLRLPEQKRNVSVYLFSSESEYRKFLAAVYPTLPNRRAYFVGSAVELAVFTYWGDRIQEDLRHEYTHGVLHACLEQVPLWLDEGLAEYYEVPGKIPGGVQPEYASRLGNAVAKGWRPDLERLEKIQNFSDLTYFDYQESWAWVHYLMHSSADTRMVLIDYVTTLQTAGTPSRLSVALNRDVPQVGPRFLNYVANLHTVRLLADEGIVTAQQPVNPNPLQQMSGTAEIPPFAVPEVRLIYQIRLPDGLPESLPIPGITGNMVMVDTRKLYEQAHQEGWNEARDLFISGKLNLIDETAARTYGQMTRRYPHPILHQARLTGLEDCQRALIKLVRESDELTVRQALRAQSDPVHNSHSRP